MIEISAGTISIDSQDLSLIPRDTIRSCLNIVPQEPFFLYGTIRLNLDPSGGATTLLIETALRRVGLYDLVNSKGGLDVQMNEEFLSHGQRQLFCLARALLRPGKILALDEVTSSVDLDTDVLMQQIIREEFKEHTIIAIAHRLETIKDFDRVVVMDEGKIVECDAPETLLAKEGSAFKKLFEMYKTPEGI